MPPFRFTTPDTADLFSARRWVQAMLRFEAGLARAEAEAGVIPAAAARLIAAACQIEHFDVDDLMRETMVASTPAIPLVRRLTELSGPDAGRYVHWGATSQDCVDTATVLLVREGLDALMERLGGVAGACARLAAEHRRTVM